jgi:hypothetical protein
MLGVGNTPEQRQLIMMADGALACGQRAGSWSRKRTSRRARPPPMPQQQAGAMPMRPQAPTGQQFGPVSVPLGVCETARPIWK